jgi:A/G-specific adenine glycosylase
MTVNKDRMASFKRSIRVFYKSGRRALPWREHISPYRVLVSEIMLQQTQVSRVIDKFPLFVKEFPSFSTLASADQAHILKVWQGLGYNRRALALKKIADTLKGKGTQHYFSDPALLQTLPGIGRATACSIAVFSSNKPFAFIETNIRRVFIHFFFDDKDLVTDDEILPLVEITMDKREPREWFYALMDYGSTLPRVLKNNPNKKSAQYKVQSSFIGSQRQIRGSIVRLLLVYKRGITLQALRKAIAVDIDRALDDKQFRVAYEALIKEGFCKKVGNMLILK